ncbi:kinetochore protein Spc24-like isoform X1 [Ambystoma mexicanum]|uniref:kinetochore protein Spc24-like isoform X1 n=1 Tax=Ambystoma mexicanum TaxID=8296 RepID=UPI0037E89FBC
MFGGQMKEMMEVSHEIIKMLNSGNLNFQKTFDKQDLIVDKLLETKVSAAEIIKDLLNLEKEAAQKLLDCADEKQQCMSQLCKIEQELHEVGEQNASLQTDIKFLTKELEELMAMEAEMQRMQEEVDEDTTEVIPSARYLAQLYHKVTKIDWDYSTEPTLIKGIHYGGEVAQPINIDATQHSKAFISDYLWSLIPTEW